MAANSGHSAGARVSASSLGRPVAAADTQGPFPSRYCVSSSVRASSPLAAAVRRSPAVDDGHRRDRLAREDVRGQCGHPLEDRFQRVLGEGEPAELVEGVLAGDGVVVGGIHVLRSVESYRTDTCRR